MGILTDAQGILTQNATQKAVLYILNPSQYKTAEISAIAKAANELEKKLRKTDKVALDASISLKKSLGLNSKRADAEIAEIVEGNDMFLKMEVQYNPASLRLFSGIGKQQSFDRNDNGLNKLTVINLAGKSRLSCDLFFDDMNIQDSFMLEGLTPNVGNAADKVKDLATHGLKGHTVRPKMDALMSLLSSYHAQQVVFHWSTMVFRGTLTNVQNDFMMFNTRGNPVRGKVHIEITQETSKNGDLDYKNDIWDDAFYAIFKENEAGKKSAMSKIANGSLLNLSL